jgi:hypothetical protein
MIVYFVFIYFVRNWMDLDFSKEVIWRIIIVSSEQTFP